MTMLPDFIHPVTEGETVIEAPAVEKAGWGLMAEFETPAQISGRRQSNANKASVAGHPHAYPVHGLDKAMLSSLLS